MSAQGDFWARRRAGIAEEAKAEARATRDQVQAEEQAAFDNMSEAEVLDALDLPNPDDLKQGDDFAAFMSKAVPDQIRRRALRTLWRSNPVLANVDMLVDYGEDFTDAAMAVENIQTAYQVGKGMLKHVEEMARQAKERASPSEPEEEVLEEEEDVTLATAFDEPTQIEEPVGGEAEEVETYAAATPRRMKFRLEETA